MAKRKEITCRGFIGGRPIEELTQKELDAWRERAVQRMGSAVADYLTVHRDALKAMTAAGVIRNA